MIKTFSLNQHADIAGLLRKIILYQGVWQLSMKF